MRAVRLTWTIGGVGLVLCGVIGVLRYSPPGAGPVITFAGDVVFAGAVLLFAIGLSREASVVARRPLGLTALVVVALWPLVVQLAYSLLLPAMDADTFDVGLDAYRAAESMLTTVFYLDLLVSLAAALIAVVQIARAGIVPRPWRWAPLWALLLSVGGGAIPQLMLTLAGPVAAQNLVQVAVLIGMLGFLSQTLGLGIVALVLASRVGSRDVEVFRSA